MMGWVFVSHHEDAGNERYGSLFEAAMFAKGNWLLRTFPYKRMGVGEGGANVENFLFEEAINIAGVAVHIGIGDYSDLPYEALEAQRQWVLDRKISRAWEKNEL